MIYNRAALWPCCTDRRDRRNNFGFVSPDAIRTEIGRPGASRRLRAAMVTPSRSRDRGLAGRAAHRPGRAAALLQPGDHDGADTANRVPPGAAPDRGADRLRP